MQTAMSGSKSDAEHHQDTEDHQPEDIDQHNDTEGNQSQTLRMQNRKTTGLRSRQPGDRDKELPALPRDNRNSFPVTAESSAAAAARAERYLAESDPSRDSYEQESPPPRHVTDRTSGDVNTFVQRGHTGQSNIAQHGTAGTSNIRRQASGEEHNATARAFIATSGTTPARGYGSPERTSSRPLSESAATIRRPVARQPSPLATIREPTGTVSSQPAARIESSGIIPSRSTARLQSSGTVSSRPTSRLEPNDTVSSRMTARIEPSGAAATRPPPPVQPSGTIPSRRAAPRSASDSAAPQFSSAPATPQSSSAPAPPRAPPPRPPAPANDDDIIIPVDLAADIDKLIAAIKEDMFQGWHGMDLLKEHVDKCGDRVTRFGMRQIRHPTMPQHWLDHQTEELQEVWGLLDRIENTFERVRDRVAAFKETVP